MIPINLPTIKKIVLIINAIIATLAIVILLLNLDIFYVSHASTGMLPVITYETYSTIETSYLYILIALIGISSYLSLTKRLKKWESVRILIISLLSLIPIIFLMLLSVNPHFLIILPRGSAPTRIIEIYPGLIFIIILFIAFFVNTLLIIQQEGYIFKYGIALSLFIGALLISHAIHESGHALLAILSGGQVVKFYPFPIFQDGVLRTGYVTYQNVPSFLIPLVTLGGEVLQWIVIPIILFILIRIRTPRILNLFLIFLLAISWLDFPLYVINNSLGLPHWFVIGCDHGDIISFTIQTGFPLWAMLIFAFLQLAIGIIIFYFKLLKNYVPIKNQFARKNIPLIDK
ncbi:MAG: hypothetical protein ACFE88_03375 [Candidatus Hermodarchaeota archaeon]